MNTILNKKIYSEHKKLLKNVLKHNLNVSFLSFVQPNPKQHSEEKTRTRYANYMNSHTPREFFAQGGKFVDFIWDFEHKFINFDESVLSLADVETISNTSEIFKLMIITRKSIVNIRRKINKKLTLLKRKKAKPNGNANHLEREIGKRPRPSPSPAAVLAVYVGDAPAVAAPEPYAEVPADPAPAAYAAPAFVAPAPAPAPVPVPIGDGWWKKEDPGSGRAYFVHERTDKCQWDPPN